MCSKLLVAFCLLAPFALSVLAQMDMAEPMEEEEDMMMGFDDMDRQDDDEWIHFRADGTGAPPAGGGQATTGAPCSPTGKCFGDRDCGAKGRCIGFGAGTCDCSQCLQASLCNLGEVVGQRSCGGLEGACNQTSNLCNCEAGYKQAGFASFGDAVLKFCNKQECDGQSNSCFGLPCKAGFCMCL